MTGLDRTALGLNALTVLTWMVGFANQSDGMLFVCLSVTLCALLAGSIAITQKQRGQAVPAVREPSVPVNELDAHQVLDLDARLEALERAQHDAVDAARWRALVESGQVTAPAAAPPSAAGDARRQLVAS